MFSIGRINHLFVFLTFLFLAQFAGGGQCPEGVVVDDYGNCSVYLNNGNVSPGDYDQELANQKLAAPSSGPASGPLDTITTSSDISNSQPSSGACKAALKKMQNYCKGLSDQQVAMAMAQYSSALANHGNGKSSADSSALTSAAAVGASSNTYYNCGGTARTCVDTCQEEEDSYAGLTDKDSLKKKELAESYRTQCEGKAAETKMGLIGTLMNAIPSIMNALNAGKQLNSTPGYQAPPPFNPNANMGSNTGAGGPMDPPTMPALDANGMDMKPSTAQPSINPANDSASSGFGGGAPLGPQGGAAQGGGGAGGPSGLNTGIDHGTTSGGGGFVSGGGGGWNGNVGPNKGDRNGMNLDLSKYLPGGECDPAHPGKNCAARGIASEGTSLATKGITGANDLSNFEKVTRMMNRKRPMMKQ